MVSITIGRKKLYLSTSIMYIFLAIFVLNAMHEKQMENVASNTVVAKTIVNKQDEIAAVSPVKLDLGSLQNLPEPSKKDTESLQPGKLVDLNLITDITKAEVAPEVPALVASNLQVMQIAMVAAPPPAVVSPVAAAELATQVPSVAVTQPIAQIITQPTPTLIDTPAVTTTTPVTTPIVVTVTPQTVPVLLPIVTVTAPKVGPTIIVTTPICALICTPVATPSL